RRSSVLLGWDADGLYDLFQPERPRSLDQDSVAGADRSAQVVDHLPTVLVTVDCLAPQASALGLLGDQAASGADGHQLVDGAGSAASDRRVPLALISTKLQHVAQHRNSA